MYELLNHFQSFSNKCNFTHKYAYNMIIKRYLLQFVKYCGRER